MTSTLIPTPDARPAGGLAVGLAAEDWTGDARFFEYHQAVDPIGSGVIPAVPLRRFPTVAGGTTGVVPLDLSAELGTPWPATSPALLASFVTVAAGDRLPFAPVATSELYFVLRGRGRTSIDSGASPASPSAHSGASPASPSAHRGVIDWEEGDVVVLPAGAGAVHEATADATLYHVSDAPLLAYLGVRPTQARFAPTRFGRSRLAEELDRVASAPDAATRNRVSVLLGTAEQTQTLTVTHTLWAMLGLVPAGAVQRPHRHQSVALDLVVDCRPGCYTLLGQQVDPGTGAIVDPVRVDWEPGAAFVTPPGMWHSHHNESGRPARILPIQDAGLHTYLRTLDIRFASGEAGEAPQFQR